MSSKITFETRIDKAVATDRHNNGYALSGALLTPATEPGKVWVSATNSKMLAAVKSDGHADAPHIIPASALPHKTPTGKYKPTAETNTDTGHWIKDGNVMAGADVEGRFPPLGGCMPENVADDTAYHPAVYCVDIDMLRDLLEAIAPKDNPHGPARGVCIKIPVSPNKPWVIASDNGVGVIMPVTPAHDTAHFAALIKAYRDDERAASKAKEVKPAATVA